MTKAAWREGSQRQNQTSKEGRQERKGDAKGWRQRLTSKSLRVALLLASSLASRGESPLCHAGGIKRARRGRCYEILSFLPISFPFLTEKVKKNFMGDRINRKINSVIQLCHTVEKNVSRLCVRVLFSGFHGFFLRKTCNSLFLNKKLIEAMI